MKVLASIAPLILATTSACAPQVRDFPGHGMQSGQCADSDDCFPGSICQIPPDSSRGECVTPEGNKVESRRHLPKNPGNYFLLRIPPQSRYNFAR